ncbi:MAG: efflux RND transporter periplasmic adaptor subunit, partial [Lachnospiraceae bacterium]|nr:efflux RND transporter periplasmic adaptor subunit [Lachnospiraceae bacterium]
MEGNRKKKIIVGFFVFLGLMWLCTVVSKSIYASELPIVSTESIEKKYVEHTVNVDGIVVAGDKNSVTALGGLRIDKLAVQVGDQVEEGDVLFTIDMDDLTDIIDEKQTAVSKLQTQINTLAQNEELARQKRELEEQRAREDY